MKAAVLFGPNDLRFEDKPTPVLSPGEVLVKVAEVGICASDVHWLRDGRIGDTVVAGPLILGHEFSGVIAELGPDVTGLKVGDRVAVEPGIACMECDMCAEENYNLCRKIQFAGTYPVDGAFREYLPWPARFVEKLPDSMTMGEAAMLDPLGVGLYAVDLAGDIAGKTVGVLGSGAIGLSILQCALAAGCGDIFVTDLIPGRLKLARDLGATRTFDAADPDLINDIKSTLDREPDIIFEAAGENEAVRQALELIRPMGRIVVAGIPYDDNLSFSTSRARRKAANFQFVRRSNKTLERSIELVVEGKADVASYITHKLPFDRIVEAFEIAAERRDGALRVILQLSE